MKLVIKKDASIHGVSTVMCTIAVCIGIILNLGSARTFWILTLLRKMNKPKGACKVLGFSARKCLCKNIRGHVFRRTVQKLNLPVVNFVADEVISNINMFSSHVVLTLRVSE